MSVHFRNCWMDFEICCFELASLDVLISADSRFKPVVGGEIWYPCSAKRAFAGAKKHRFSASEKIPFFRRPKKHRTSWTTQKAQCKNITRKRKDDGKYIWENSQKKYFFRGNFVLFRNYFAQS